MTDHTTREPDEPPEPLLEQMVEVAAGQLRLVDAGPRDGAPVLFLHGWPQSALAFEQVMRLAAADGYHALAIDLPGIGGSSAARTDGTTAAVADVVHDLVQRLELADLVLVGHDLGGMTTYSYLRRHGGLAGAVIMNTVVPGIDPWEEVLRNPYIWHFAFHTIPDLPELLVEGRQREYFDFFFDALSPSGSGVTPAARDAYASAYASGSLSAGFDWYRKLWQDAADHADAAIGDAVSTPLLYLRGDGEGGQIDSYVAGFADAGLSDVRSATISGAGHFAPEDAPERVWERVGAFAADVSGGTAAQDVPQ